MRGVGVMRVRGRDAAALVQPGGNPDPHAAGILRDFLRGVLVACVVGLGACEPEGLGTSAMLAESGEAMPLSERWQPGHASAYNAAILADAPGSFDRPRRATPRDSAKRDAVIAAYRTEGNAPIAGTPTQQSGGRQ